MKKIDVTDNYIKINKNNKQIKICLLSDLHISAKFNLKKLDLIKEKLKELSPKYIFIAGDIIDTSKFLKSNKNVVDQTIDFFKYLGSNYQVFINRGNHDIKYKKGLKKYNLDFWKKIENIKNIYLSTNNFYFENNDIFVCNYEIKSNYYCKNKKRNKSLLIKELSKIDNVNKRKVKILMIHSPFLIDDNNVLKNISSYDLILCGHMHNGLVPPLLDKLFKNNRGIIAPGRKLFPDNARGSKIINYNNKVINLIICGGITKLAENSKIFSLFNFIYPMSINNIIINK